MDDGYSDASEPTMRAQLLAARSDVAEKIGMFTNPGPTGNGSELFRPKGLIKELTATLAEIDEALRLTYPDDA